MTNIRSFITSKYIFPYDAEKWYLTEKGFLKAVDLKVKDKILSYNCLNNKVVYDKVLSISKSQWSIIYNIKSFLQAVSSLEVPIFLYANSNIKDDLFIRKDKKIFKDSVLQGANYNGKHILRVNVDKIKYDYSIIKTESNIVTLLGLIYFFKFKNYIIIEKRLFSQLRQLFKFVGTYKETIRVDDTFFVKFSLTPVYRVDFFEKLSIKLKSKILDIIYQNDFKMLMKRSHYQMKSLGVYKENKRYVFKKFNKASYCEKQILSINKEEYIKQSDILIEDNRGSFIEVRNKHVSNKSFPITNLPHFVFPSGMMVLSNIRINDAAAYYEKIIDLHRR